MGTLEDQLKKWKQQKPSTDSAAASKSSSSKPSSSKSSKPSSSSKAALPDEPARRPSTKKNPYPAYTLRRDEAVSTSVASKPPAPPPTDAELFARAVQDVDRDVVLQKFDAGASSSTTTKGARSAPVAAPPTDEELFLSFVGSARTSSSSSSSRTESGPVARLSLRGASGDVAARRLRAFLDESVRAGALSVVVEVDAGSDQAVDVARGHAAVLSVRDAAAADGGKGARVVRFKT